MPPTGGPSPLRLGRRRCRGSDAVAALPIGGLVLGSLTLMMVLNPQLGLNQVAEVRCHKARASDNATR